MAVKKNGAKKRLTVGLAYDMIPPGCSEEERQNYMRRAEWDSPETIERIVHALEKPGSKVKRMGVYTHGDYDFRSKLKELDPKLDIVFNISEGNAYIGDHGIKHRESIVPAFVSSWHIPYTGSDALALGIALDKALTLEILRNYGINVAPYFVFNDSDSISRYTKHLEQAFPLIVKPVSEGTSIGMDQDSVVEDMEQLKASVDRMINEYRQPAMAQQFLEKEEHTVGILGNRILPILKIDLEKMPDKPRIRDPEIKEIDTSYSGPLRFGESYVFLAAQSAIAHTALGCYDYNRLDFRRGKDGKIYLLEANPLPGLDPVGSDFPKMCDLAGIDYDSMINMILEAAVKRYQGEPEFAGRFPVSRTGHITEFIKPAIDRLETYPTFVSSNNGDNISYRLLKVKR